MGSVAKAIRVVLGNVVIFLVIAMFINLYFAGRADRKLFFASSEDSRAFLPAYEDHERALLVFAEGKRLRTGYRPFVGWSRLPFEGETTTVGPDGDRQHSHASDRVEGEVHFFGGSTIWGTGVEDEQTIPALFERELPHYRAYNHGESALNARQGLANLIEVYRRGDRPDWVVFYDGANDVAHNCRPDVGAFGHARLEQIRLRVETPRTVSALFGSVLEKYAAAYRRLFPDRFRDPAEQVECHESPEVQQQVVDGLFTSWNLARQLVEANGGRFIAILQPVAFMGDAPVDYLDLEKKQFRARNMRFFYPLLQKRVASERAAGADWLFDFTDAFDGDRNVYIDFCHVNALGNGIIAERIAREVERRDANPAPIAKEPETRASAPRDDAPSAAIQDLVDPLAVGARRRIAAVHVARQDDRPPR